MKVFLIYQFYESTEIMSSLTYCYVQIVLMQIIFKIRMEKTERD